jgi:hypothetical protein
MWLSFAKPGHDENLQAVLFCIGAQSAAPFQLFYIKALNLL